MRKILLVIFSLCTIAIAVAYLVSCLTPYISPAKFWPMTFLSLGFPLLAFCMLILTVAWAIGHRKTGLVLLVVFLLGFNNLVSIFAFSIPSTFIIKKDTGTLRVLDWNVWHFAENNKSAESPKGIRRQMINYLKEANADVLLMQEFEDIKSTIHYSNIKVLQDTLGYKYYFLSQDLTSPSVKQKSKLRCAIFSKLPLSNMQRFEISSDPFEEFLVLGDVTYKNKKIRIATMHLNSLNLGEPPNKDKFFGRVSSDFLMQASRMEKIKFFDGEHGRQADEVRNILNQSPHPVIVAGDFNSVPGSYAYHTVKGNLNDAFLKKGFGFGRTYSGLSPTLRIDFFMADKLLKIKQYHSPRLYLSDHFPVIADLDWN